jgi:serine phosphatase RsbU (regulator of sigma subunit)
MTSRPTDLPLAYVTALDDVLASAHLMPPDALADLAARGARHLGASAAVLWLVDHEQRVLVALQPPHEEVRPALSVEGSLAGRAFRTVEPVETDAGEDGRRLWAPLLDGADRLGALEVVVPGDAPLAEEHVRTFVQLASLLAELLVNNSAVTDHYEWFRRQAPMALPAEVVHALLPPLTFGTDKVVVSGLLAPAYEVGGDAYDYALNGNIAHLAVFDAVGHGLQASLLAALSVTTYRNTRRAGLSLAHSALVLDRAIAEMFGGERYVTALLAQLDVDTGVLQVVGAGHPAPMLLRGTRVVKELVPPPALPLGLNGLLGEPTNADFPVLTEDLQPGDRLLLVTDGVDEARDESGAFFGRERLAEFAAREAASGLPAPELVRRLQQRILRHQTGRLQDDATTVVLEWPSRPETLVP